MIKVLKSPKDKSKYYAYKNNKNGLNVFLTQDVDADISCIAMVVKVGYMNDFIPGLAHFLEHMLFNGTSKYPNENEFMTYISTHGGYTNAYTTHDHTCYYYTIQSENVKKSLDMFAQFFISPLLKKDSVNREKEAVDAEHTKNIYDDNWRFNEILRKACYKDHPISNFGTGSNKTLSVENIEKIVRQFYETYYSSDIMTLFVTTKNDCIKLQDYINNLFGEIKCIHDKQIIKYNKMLEVPKIIKVLPIEDTERIVLNWELPSYKQNKHQSPYILLSHILGHEGYNSLHYILTQKEYISMLVSGINIIVNDKCIFFIEMRLSPLGAKYRNNIISIIFEYIDMIKTQVNSDHIKQLYNELLTINRFQFKHIVKYNADQLTRHYCELICKYDISLRYLPTIAYIDDEYEPMVKKNIKYVLNEMRIDNCIIIIGSKEYEKIVDTQDEYYKTMYSITNDILQLHKNKEIYELPILNPFISTEEQIVTITHEEPQILDKNGIYWLPTNKFNTPTVRINVKIDLPLSIENKKIHTETLLYFNTIITEINYKKYLCSSANYDIDVTYNLTGELYITIQGNVGKIYDVCNFLVTELLNTKNITQKSFDSTLYLLENHETNIIMEKPYLRLGSYFNKKLCSKYYDNYDRLSVIKTIKIDNIINVIGYILKLSKLTILTSGVVTLELANNITSIFNKFVPDKLYVPSNDICNLYTIPNNNELISIPIENAHDTNNAMGYYIYLGHIMYGITKDWEKLICLSNILDSIIANNYFDTLRTKEKFGYIVKGTKVDVGDKQCTHKYYVFIVQSPERKVTDIIERTEQFIIDFRYSIINISNDDFNNYINSSIKKILTPANNLEEFAEFYYNTEILTNYLQFNIKDIIVKTYKSLTKKDLLKFYDDKFINKKSVIIGINGNNTQIDK